MSLGDATIIVTASCLRMRSRPTGSTGSNGPGQGASLQSGRRAWNLEGILLVTGLASVFVLGVMLSSRIHMLEPQHGRINYEKQLHAGDSLVKTTWREDYSQSREELVLILTQRDAASSAYDLRKLSLHELIKAAFGDQDSSELAQLGASVETAVGPHDMPSVVRARDMAASMTNNKSDGATLRTRAPQGASIPKSRGRASAAGGDGEQGVGNGMTSHPSSATSALPKWKIALQRAPLLIICHDRADYLDRTLRAVYKHHPGDSLVPIIISEDGHHANLAQVIETHRAAFAARYPSLVFLHIHHLQDPSAPTGYHKLAQHYKWALSQVFDHLSELDARLASAHNVILLEEDLEIAPDFFNFFGALAPLLDSDQTLMAVSAFNDNGMAERVRDPTALYRSDFFPGLGWMMPRRLWQELEPKWPKAYWDDWLREPTQRKGRQVIRPEVCRTFHFGLRGTSNAEYSDYLGAIRLNDHYVDFEAMDLASALEPNHYESGFMKRVVDARPVSVEDLLSGEVEEEAVKVAYDVLSGAGNSFESIARRLGVMDNIKARVPRTAYQGVVTFWRGPIKVYIVPKNKMY